MALLDRPFGPVSQAATVPSQIPMNQQAAQSGPLPVKQVIVSTAETLIMSAENASVPLTIAIEPNTGLEQTPFDLSVSGYITTTNATNLTLTVYKENAIVSGNLLKASALTTQTNTTESFWIHGRLIYNSVSGTLSGVIGFYINRTLTAEATLANFPTGVTNTGDPVVVFCLSLTSGAAAPGTATTINIQKFSAG